MSSLSTRLQRYKRLKTLIRRKATGTPQELAGRLNISERTLYRDLNELKMMGFSVAYSFWENSYVEIKDHTTIQSNELNFT